MGFLKSIIKTNRTIYIFILIFICSNSFSQNNPLKKYIFIPHPRSNDRVNQSVEKEIEQIDFSKYEMILLGGDLTYYTTINQKSMDYCDSIFDLGNENTLWAVGNHDLSNRSLVTEYTKRPTFYSLTKNNITFLVLDTEIDSKNFETSYISGEQLELIKNVTDTISQSDYLILLQHRLLWMIGNNDLAKKVDSVGASTRELDTANFYEEVYPLIHKAKKNGVKILCLGGDRADINIEYMPEDSITYLASTMVPEFDANTNHVIILNHKIDSGKITWNFVPLSQIEKKETDTNQVDVINYSIPNNLKVYPNPSTGDINISYYNELNSKISISIFNILGKVVFSEILKPNENYNRKITLTEKNFYLLKINNDYQVYTQKVIIW